MSEDLYFKQIEVGPMANFVYLIGSKRTREALVIDAAWDITHIITVLEEDDMSLAGALITHTHPDHVGGNLGGHSIEGIEALLQRHEVPVYVHRSEADHMPIAASQITPTDAHTSITLGDVAVQCIHTPGHTPGSQCFKLADRLVAGDTLFIGGCGRVDLPGSNPEDMYESLTQKLMRLADDTMVFPGHNYAEGQPHSTIASEKTNNPYLHFPDKVSFLAAMGY